MIISHKAGCTTIPRIAPTATINIAIKMSNNMIWLYPGRAGRNWSRRARTRRKQLNGISCVNGNYSS
jgi:hypothetical protein